jgi:hypothetical protein
MIICTDDFHSYLLDNVDKSCSIFCKVFILPKSFFGLFVGFWFLGLKNKFRL